MMQRLWLAGAFALLSACAPDPGPKRVVEARSSGEAAPRGVGLLERAMLDGHNAARRDVGVPPLVWDAGLAADAKRYADELARTRKFAHSREPRGSVAQGENLFTGTRGAYSYAEMVGLWVDEKRDFVNAATPDFSRTGKWGDVAHYTQIVWRTTSRFGCALASNDRDDYLVCRYVVPGNVVGVKAF